MKKENNDKVFIVDGRERTGKSTWTFQQAAYIDPEMFETPEKMCSRICFTPEEFLDAVRKVKNGVVIFDEAFRGFSSRATMSKVNKNLVQALMEMGQNNLIVFIVLPSFFLLDIYPAMLRSDGLFNVYAERKTRLRAWRGYNKKDKNSIYQIGLKKGWTYAFNSSFKGRFYGKFPGGKEYEAAYLKKKRDSFVTAEETKKEASYIQISHTYQRDKLIQLTYPFLNDYLKQVGKPKITLKRYSEWLREQNVDIDLKNVSKIMKKQLIAPEKQPNIRISSPLLPN